MEMRMIREGVREFKHEWHMLHIPEIVSNEIETEDPEKRRDRLKKLEENLKKSGSE
jgi:hypothetical protein